MGTTRSCRPVPWLGSTTMGRCERSFTAGTILRSRVFLVYSTNVRIPRSQRITLWFPPERMYSALMRNSFSVAARPRLSRTGLEIFDSARRSFVFCILRAPTCRRSAYSATTSTSAASMTSVTIPRPVLSLAFARSFSPSSPIPWNTYGLVRGLYAPPRSKRAPAAFTASADRRICCSDSTEQGPAITTISLPPIGTPATMTTLSSDLNSRLASLYGLSIGITSST